MYLCGPWLQNVSDELHTNMKGFLPSCKASLTNTLAYFLNNETDNFNLEYMIMALYMYLCPQTSWSHAQDLNQVPASVAGAAAQWS